MNLYNEFFSIIPYFNKMGVRYAVVGGIALAFHDRPRFTDDIDILVHPEDLELVKITFDRLDYRESTNPWTFKNTNLTLHRFLKIVPDDELIVDILLANTDKHQKIISDAIDADSKDGIIRVARKVDLIWLKQFRNSSQDKVDIENLKNDQD